ncbi:MAG: glycoside hydrolase family 3 C-terminal domain-containing protein [Bacteroidales bacterium]|nr:glycoside hydrolase family 3 C-terminal domain-containing protein [Bacteroidales bacterium]
MKKIKLSAMALALAPAMASAQELPKYLNPALSVEERVEDALSRMTLEEKCRMVYAQSKFSSPGVSRLGIPELWTSDGPHGVRMEINWNDWAHSNWTNDYCTAFPALTCLAASWNPEMASLYGKNVGEEARYRKKSVLLGPGVNLYRTPLNGRNFEYMGEDPYLASIMVVPYIQGLQSNGVACCVKHYVLNDQEEFRGHVDVKVSDRALYELYLRPFEAAVKEGNAWSLMGSYNQYKDQHVSHNERLLNDILKGEWGFDGAVITDWGACHDTDEAIKYGLDLEMGSFTNGLTSEANGFGYDDYYLGSAYLNKAKNGEVPMEIVNDKARRMLRLLFRTEMNPNRGWGSMHTQAHLDACREIAREGIVLLKNETNLLPLNEANLKGKTILVVGENATRKLTEGGGSSELKAKDEVSPLRAIQERYGKIAKVEYAAGYKSGPSMYGRVIVIPEEEQAKLRVEAVEKAKKADLVIYVGGLNKNHFQDCEGGDRRQYELDFFQNELISELAAANQNMVTVIISGNAYAMPWLSQVKTLVQSWYNGSQAGYALTDILSGDVNPSGKLPFTMAVSLEDYPAHKLGRVAYPGIPADSMPTVFKYGKENPASATLLKKGFFEKQVKEIAKNNDINTRSNSLEAHDYSAAPGTEAVIYAEDILLGYRWFDTKGFNGTYANAKSRVLFPFGYGLSYTTFEYGKPQISGNTVTVTVKNTGKVAGKEIVQWYVGDDKASVIRPKKELKHFEKIALAPGEEKTVSYTINEKDLQFFDETKHAWVAEPGTFTITVAASSVDVKGTVKYTQK